MNTTEGYTTTDLNRVPKPPGATFITEWTDRQCELPYRLFRVSARTIDASVGGWPWSEDVSVNVGGIQYADAGLRFEITVHQLHGDVPIGPAQACQLARALIAAAEEINDLSGVGR
jgi:hypothetical protein